MPANVAHATSYVSAADLSCSPKTAVIIGATFGIGSMSAQILTILGCQRIILCGRTESRASVVIDKCKAAKPDSKSEHVFIKADVSTLTGMRNCVQDVTAVTGKQGIDYLFMTQNGVPTGKIEETADGIDFGFAVQAVSRFVVAYLLATGGFLKTGATVVSVANTGQNLSWLKVDDMSLKKRSTTRWKIGLFMDQSFRDSCVLDAWHLEMIKRFPKYTFLHIHPGICKTDNFDISFFPFPLSLAVRLALVTIATTPEQFGPVPIYLAISSEEERRLQLDGSNFFQYNLAKSTPGEWASNEENRRELWTWLMNFLQGKL